MGRKPVNRSAEEKRIIKIESRKRHQSDLRRAMAVADYLLLTATEQHRKATIFVQELERKYPGKRDVRKTYEYREWQRNQILQTSTPEHRTPATNKKTVSSQSQKEMVLRIPLIESAAKATPSVPGETQPDNLTSIFQDIPNEVMNQLIEDISADPDLSAIMNDFCSDEEVPDIDFDIDLDINLNISPLEVEINNLLS